MRRPATDASPVRRRGSKRRIGAASTSLAWMSLTVPCGPAWPPETESRPAASCRATWLSGLVRAAPSTRASNRQPACVRPNSGRPAAGQIRAARPVAAGVAGGPIRPTDTRPQSAAATASAPALRSARPVNSTSAASTASSLKRSFARASSWKAKPPASWPSRRRETSRLSCGSPPPSTRSAHSPPPKARLARAPLAVWTASRRRSAVQPRSPSARETAGASTAKSRSARSTACPAAGSAADTAWTA